MTAPTVTVASGLAGPDVLVETRRSIAWDAVIAGALVGLAVTICLSLAGAAMGFTLIDPWGNSGPSGTMVSIGAMIWLFVVNILGMGIGGYIAGRGARLETTMELADIRFRCAAQGLTVWAIATVLAGVLGVSAVTSAFSLAAHTAGAMAGGAGAGLAASDDDDIADMGFHVRRLFAGQVAPGQGQSTQPSQPAPAAPAAAFPPAQSQSQAKADYGDDAMDEAGSILARAWQRNGLEPSEKTYLAALLARHNGISQAEAEKRVTDTETNLKAAMAKAEVQGKEEAARAAKGSALAALFAFLSLAIGAVAAVVGALHYGTRLVVVR